MNTLSFKEFCNIFCCPPCPTSIASKLAFLPPNSTYTVSSDDDGITYNMHLTERAEFQYRETELEGLEMIKAKTKRGNKICMMFVHCVRKEDSRYTILYSHGNAVDLGLMSSYYISLGTRLKTNIFSYDYSGYGESEGKPSEKNLYYDIDTAYFVLRTRFGINPENIILYGQSIGTVPTIDLASRYDVAAVILHAPLLSGLRVACPESKRTWCCDSFNSIDKIHKIKSPVLVIHGTDDEVVDFTHGLEMYDRMPITVEPLWVEGAGHNDVEMYSQFLERLKRLVHVDIPKLQQSNKSSGDHGIK